jgi:two-component system cell cycle sensor histidine kinase/response regulator CckA
MDQKTFEDLLAENQELSAQLEEAQETLNAIRRGEVDGLVISTPKGDQVYTITGAEKPYRVLIEEMKEGAVMLSDDDTILYCNIGFAKMMKSHLEKLVGIKIGEMVSPTFKADFEDLLTECRGVGKKNSLTKGITFISGDKSLVPTQISVNSLSVNNTITTFIVVTDLTEHMAQELRTYTSDLEKAGAALFESEQRWSTTLASIGDAVIATDLSGKITFMNAVAKELTRWFLAEASGKPVQEIFKIINEKTRETIEDPVSKVIEKGKIVGIGNHTVLLRRDGTEIAVDDSGAPIKNKDGKITGAVLIFRNISERRELERKVEAYTNNLESLIKERTEKLKGAERLAAIGATAGMVGHDIRNPLQAITGDLFLAREELKVMPQSVGKQAMEESLDSIEENIVYINKIVSDLQDYTRPLKPEVERVNIKDLIQTTITLVDLPDNIQVDLLADQKFIFNADPAFLRRTLTNLIVNAVQAMPNGGKLTIGAQHKANTAVICVKDTGVGIPEEIKHNLFTPLFTTKAKGQGLGLAVVKRLVDAMNGLIVFESQIGKGTTFTVTLPLKPDKIESK